MREDWVECQFGDLLDYEQPTNYIVKSTEYNDTFKIPVLTAGKTFIKGYTNELTGIYEDLPVIIFDDFTTASQFVDFKFKVKSSAMKILKPISDEVNLKFIFYCMQINNIRNDTHKRYWISTFAKNNLWLPPITIQRAILNKIENIFVSLDKGTADLQKAQTQLKVYRQAVLKKAFESTKEIKRMFDVNEIIQIGPFGSQLHQNDYIEDGIPLINPIHIQNGKIKPNSSYSISEFKRNSLPNYILKKGDVIMERRGEMGRCALVSEKEIGWFCGTGSLFLRPNQKIIYPQYLYYYLSSPVIKDLLTDQAKGTTMMNLNKKIINDLPIHLPSVKIQTEIVREIESRLSICDELEQSITESLEKSKSLRQSILKKAFEGSLLSEEEINKCKQEADYEHAGELLKRIKSEKK